jgi:phosphatidate cytidylyltransferase
MLKHRVLTAIVLLVVALWALFFADSTYWVGVMVLVSALAAWEWAGFVRLTRLFVRGSYALVVALMVWLAHGWQFTDQILLYGVGLQTLFVVLAVSRYQFNQGRAVLTSPWLSLALGALLIISFALAVIALRDVFSPWILLASLAMIWAMDTGAYFSGKRFGRHKLASYVSPGKTWEGVVGGAVFVAALALLVGVFARGDVATPGLLIFVLASVVISLLSVYGDLFESLMKRQVDLKDSGRILPGHGGVLDRIDSLLVAMPLFWLFWYVALGA